MNGFIRKFALESSDGIRLTLNGEQNIWLTDPAGLGISSAPKLADYGGGFFGSTDNRYEPQQTITFTLNFTGASPYAEYQAFLDTIYSAEQWYLCYRPDEASIEYRRKISFRSITKTELTKNRWLECTVSAVCLAPWQTTQKIKFTSVSAVTGSGKPYWDGKITPMGHLPAHCVYSFKASEPRKIYGGQAFYDNPPGAVLAGAEETGTAWNVSFLDNPVSLATGETLIVSTLPNDFRAQIVTPAGKVKSVIDHLDTLFGTAQGLPPNALPVSGETSIRFIIQVDSIRAADTLNAEIYYFYKGV